MGTTSMKTHIDRICKSSNSSFFVAAVGKRLVAESMYENESFPTGEVKNLRKIYIFTLGRLEWKAEDLAQTFDATCDVNKDAGCFGLQYPLDEKRVLLAGSNDLPVRLLSPIDTAGNTNDVIRLVHVIEPSSYFGKEFIHSVEITNPGDLLLPHNIKYLQRRTSVPEDWSCYTWIENRIYNILNNHLYIEDTLQVSYTAAMFCIFQNGVIQEKLPGFESLQFENNVQEMALRLSIPAQNVTLTILGCTLLCLGAIAIVLYPFFVPEKGDPLRAVSTPQVIA